MRNLHLTFDRMYCIQKLGEDFAKFCGLLRIYELYGFQDVGKVLKFGLNSKYVDCRYTIFCLKLSQFSKQNTESPWLMPFLVLEK